MWYHISNDISFQISINYRIWHCLIWMMPFILWGWVMQDFKLLTRQLLETYLGSDTLSDVAIQDFLDSNASIIGTGKQEFFKNIENFLNSFKFDVEKRKNIHLNLKI